MNARHIVARLALVAVAALAIAAPARAQQQAAPARQAQEQRLRQALGNVVRRQLDLTDQQAERLIQVSSGFERDRRQLQVRERETRQLVREEMLNESPDQARVARGIERMLEIQKQRVAIVEREQAELAKFLTPVQRAKYLVLQDQLRKRLEDMRRQRETGAVRPMLQRRLRDRAPGAGAP